MKRIYSFCTSFSLLKAFCIAFVMSSTMSIGLPSGTFEFIYDYPTSPSIGQYGFFSIDQTLDEGNVLIGTDLLNRITLHKTDVAGTLSWSKLLGLPYQSWRRDLSIKQATNNEAVWTTGVTNLGPTNLTTYVSSCNASTGAMNWGQGYTPIVNGDPWLSGTSSVMVHRNPSYSGEIVVGGMASDPSTASQESFFIMKLAATGSVLWSKIYYLGGLEQVWCIREAIDGNIIVVGDSKVYTAALKLDASTGMVLWAQRYGNLPQHSSPTNSAFCCSKFTR